MRIFFLLLTFFLFWHAASCQSNSSDMTNFFVENEYLFRMQVSRFYPLDREMLETYEEDWSWSLVSENTDIKWTDELLEKFSGLLDWNMLQRNPSILWDETRIQRHRNIIDWFYLSQNPALPVSEAWIQNHKNEINWYFFSQNPAFTSQKALLRKFKNRIDTTFARPRYAKASYFFKQTEVPAEMSAIRDLAADEVGEALIDRYFDYWRVEEMAGLPNFPWTLQRFRLLAPGVNHHQLGDNANVYRRLFKPYLTDDMVRSVMQRLNPPGVVRFYSLKQDKDALGLIPGFTTGKGYRDPFIEKNLEPDRLLDSLPSADFFLDGIYMPPLRFADIHEWSEGRSYQTATIAVSEKVKSVLERFRLPPHRFYPVDFQLNDARYGRETRRYYIFHIATCDFQYLDYDRVIFYWVKQISFNPGMRRFNLQGAIEQKIKSPQEYLAFRDSIAQHATPYRRFQPLEYTWNADLDVIACNAESSLYPIWVSEDVKAALGAAGVTGIGFRKVRKTHPRMTGAESAAHRARNAQIIESIRSEWAQKLPENEQLTVINFKKECAWRDSVLALYGLVKKYRKDHPVTAASGSLTAKLLQKEEEWDVLLPPKFFDMASRLTYTGTFRLLVSGLKCDLLSIDQMIKVGKEWTKWYPFTAKAVLFANDGAGNYLGFLLKPGSAFELGDTIYEFDESGEVRDVGKL